jgi:hypothetical protein
MDDRRVNQRGPMPAGNQTCEEMPQDKGDKGAVSVKHRRTTHCICLLMAVMVKRTLSCKKCHGEPSAGEDNNTVHTSKIQYRHNCTHQNTLASHRRRRQALSLCEKALAAPWRCPLCVLPDDATSQLGMRSL